MWQAQPHNILQNVMNTHEMSVDLLVNDGDISGARALRLLLMLTHLPCLNK